MKLIIIFIFLFSINIAVSNSEGLFDDISDSTSKPLVCFKYKFNVGDTLIYLIHSYDSIAIDFGDPLLRTRNEIIEMTCDSIKQGRFYLSQKLIAFRSKESSKDTQNVERTYSPWLQRKSWIAIDTLGNRFASGYEDSSLAVLSPGGAFQPYILVGLGQSCNFVDKTWNYTSLDLLVENAYPVPAERQSSLFRVIDPIDTLGYKCNRISFIKTAQGSYKVVSEKDKYFVTNITNGYGIIDFSIEKNIPIHYFATGEQKMQITIDDGEPKPGCHYISTDYTLLEIKEKSKEIKLNGKKIRINKKK